MPAIVSPASRPLMLVALSAGAMVAATLALWAYLRVGGWFFEMVRTGWMACF